MKTFSSTITVLLLSFSAFVMSACSKSEETNDGGAIDCVSNLTALGIPSGNYSGICCVSSNRYAVTDDMAYGAGFVYMDLSINPSTGEVVKASRDVPPGTGMDWYEGKEYEYKKNNDSEAIIYHPSTKTLFVAGEWDSRIREYTFEGKPTGRELEIPQQFDMGHIVEAFGFESLAYSQATGLFWTTTEKPLLADAKEGYVRFQSFTEDLKPAKQYLYRADAPVGKCEMADDNDYLGVVEMVALDDGRLIILEREIFLSTQIPTDSFVRNCIYTVNPSTAAPGQMLTKTLLREFTTHMNVSKTPKFANYEGMCLGPTLSNGKQTLLLISDSQRGEGGYGANLQDYVKVISID